MSESDDSDAEGGLGNVTRVVLRPPGHSGKAKRGHLCFDASYESGNLGRVDFISEFEYDLFIRPDTCNPRYRLWFNFVVDNVRADQRVIFNIVNLSKVKTLFRDGMTPLVKTSSRPKWQRLSGKYVYYHKSPEHRNHYILSFAFSFDREEDVYQFSLSFPYSYSRVQAHLRAVEAKELPFFRRDTVAFSLQQRKLDVVTISNLPPTGLVGGKRPRVIVIMGRSHPGESPTSYVAQGLIDFLISSHPIAVILRDHLIVKIVPMLNPDGVFLGNYRSSLMGADLNRVWNQVSPWAHPTLHAFRNFLVELDASRIHFTILADASFLSRRGQDVSNATLYIAQSNVVNLIEAVELDMVIDLHGHSSLLGAFIYGNSYDDVYRFERHILFPKLLAHNAEDFNPTSTMYNRDGAKSGSARRHLCELLRNTVNVYTLEVSLYGYRTPATGSTIIPYNEDGYFRLGRNLARTFFEYYKATGVIPPNLLPPPPSGQSLSAQLGQAPSAEHRKKRSPRKAKKPPKHKEMSESELESEMLHLEQKEEKVKVLALVPAATSRESDGSCSFSSDESRPRRQSQRAWLTSPRPPVCPAKEEGQTSTSPATSRSPKRGEGNRRRVRLKASERNSGRALRQSRAVYTTFDFSTIAEAGKESGRERATCGSGRKIGGGGTIARGPRSSRAERTEQSGTGNAPCLTIIDFNLLIRSGLCGERKQSFPPVQKTPRRRRPTAKTAWVERQLKGTFHGLVVSGHRTFYKHRSSHTRRRRALVLRGNITDWSPWNEESSEESEASRFSAPPR